ncbi:hypothetical protein GCM10010413_16130 [Promicromonospora sukumoe]
MSSVANVMISVDVDDTENVEALSEWLRTEPPPAGRVPLAPSEDDEVRTQSAIAARCGDYAVRRSASASSSSPNG